MIQKAVLKKLLIGIFHVFETTTNNTVKLLHRKMMDSFFFFFFLSWTGFYQDLEKLGLESMTSHLMFQSNIVYRVYRKQRLFSGSALHLPQQLMMPRLLLLNF